MRIKATVDVPEEKFCNGFDSDDGKCKMLSWRMQYNAHICRLHREIGFLKGGAIPLKCTACLNAERVGE